MLPGEMYVADAGYRDGRMYGDTPNGLNNQEQKMKRLARARHETVNNRIKQFRVLRTTFRHKLEKHWECFHAIVNMTQVEIQYQAPLFSVEYDESA
jgi:hypothetical protein